MAKNRHENMNGGALEKLLSTFKSEVDKLTSGLNRYKIKFSYVLIGGLACYLYLKKGFRRTTYDADVIIYAENKSDIGKLLKNSRYTFLSNLGVYSKEIGDFTIEIKLVDKSDKGSLEYSTVIHRTQRDEGVYVPKVAQLFILKLVSYLGSRRSRVKDLSDALKLLQVYHEEIRTQLINWIEGYQERHKNSWLNQYGIPKNSTGTDVLELIEEIIEGKINIKDKKLISDTKTYLEDIRQVIKSYSC